VDFYWVEGEVVCFGVNISSGGALGWKTKGSLAPEFEAVAYGLDNSTTAAPKYGEAKTEFGYHIIMVEGRK
jgi:peptidyl-prolyl cis-trans isomerase NIMA-interacting 4